jgi:putative restriction endonuclease
MDVVTPLTTHRVVGRFEPAIEDALRHSPGLIDRVARAIVESEFPATVVPDVLTAAGLDPDRVLQVAAVPSPSDRRRDPRWRRAIVQAWDRQCSFCGYDGQLSGATVGIDAAHVRWFAFDGPDEPDNGLALCTLHHKLFDLGALGLDEAYRIEVSSTFTARMPAGRSLYDLHGTALRPRPGTVLPALKHVRWHRSEVFKGEALAG